MTLKETFHFSKSEYRQELWSKKLSHVELAKTIYRKRFRLLSAKSSMASGVAAFVVAGPHALPAVAISGRRASVESQKLKILEQEWKRRGHPPLKESTFKDKVIPITIAMGASFFNFQLDTALAMGSPDQFYNVNYTPNPLQNEYLMSSVYFEGVKKGVHQSGKILSRKVVSRAPQSAYDADRPIYLRNSSGKQGSPIYLRDSGRRNDHTSNESPIYLRNSGKRNDRTSSGSTIYLRNNSRNSESASKGPTLYLRDSGRKITRSSNGPPLYLRGSGSKHDADPDEDNVEEDEDESDEDQYDDDEDEDEDEDDDEEEDYSAEESDASF